MADSVAKQFIEYLEKCPHVSRTLDKFMAENCHLFAVGGVEHKMKYMELYNLYNELVEKRMVEFIEKTGTTEEAFAEALQGAVGNKDPSWEPIQAWLQKTDYEYFVEVMRKKHMTMKQLGGDEQVVFSDDDEDTES
mmetsp:Transcript_40733/g.68205  ORF Transcript_40733/g.68205 Transcript_40733/m.68205 type:complete len:136 (-) Transcript_40733:507-914(-)|eukprot:CAMPEP_0198226812 /NCGR_PEP_ID=MMETSP1445-20131203/106715_1 /TAXON_ID=36898 /ORGANISM="Pyramimonas sp., Strain CCMP2087" /LENGTH=135 /DNA_ID=CAMNT_0043906707 /DNA_START=135 /DNA_END=542 /DNA_ORIENTATION=+